jgi:hypothetical protein
LSFQNTPILKCTKLQKYSVITDMKLTILKESMHNKIKEWRATLNLGMVESHPFCREYHNISPNSTTIATAKEQVIPVFYNMPAKHTICVLMITPTQQLITCG